jgi:exodeoxyribonuclease VII large subunit
MDMAMFSPTDFVAVFNQTVSYAYPSVTIQGEVSNFRVSKNKWVYFDLKDDMASIRFFGTVYQLPTPIEDGMMLQVRGNPQLHPRFGFNITMQSVQLSGEGTIKKAAQLLESKLRREGIFDEDRKRTLPYPPNTIGLITSGESAAYADFIKVLSARWVGVDVQHYDVQVQGELAPVQIVEAIEYFNSHSQPVDVLVLIRGGGSADDLQAFSSETVTRAVAASRIPTMVAIGHEVDSSLAEQAADVRASTPSNAAELLVPDKEAEKSLLKEYTAGLKQQLQNYLQHIIAAIEQSRERLERNMAAVIKYQQRQVQQHWNMLQLVNPTHILQRGFAIIRKDSQIIVSSSQLHRGDKVVIQLKDGTSDAIVE